MKKEKPMSRRVEKIIVVRLLKNMGESLSTHHIFIIAYGFDELSSAIKPKLDPDKLKIIPRNFIDIRTLSDCVQTIKVLSKCIKEDKPDVVHVNALQDLIFSFIAVRMNAPRKSRPAIIAMSRNSFTWKKSTKAWLAAKLIQYFADGFISIATTHKNQLLSLGVPEFKIAVIPNPLDTDQGEFNYKPVHKLRAKTKKIIHVIYVANICKGKAQDILIRAAFIVLNRFPDINFDLVGKVVQGEEEFAETIFSLIHELGISDHIHYLGGVPYSEVRPLLEASDIFVFPTYSEMMPRAVIEAMAAGKPVIASAVDGILDLIQDRKTGILVQPGDPAELADKICELIENPSEAKKLGSAGQKYVLDYCSPVRVGGLFLNFYQSILNSI
jgi:glycosyltransferase involved in cell wall biosynthesis